VVPHHLVSLKFVSCRCWSAEIILSGNTIVISSEHMSECPTGFTGIDVSQPCAKVLISDDVKGLHHVFPDVNRTEI